MTILRVHLAPKLPVLLGALQRLPFPLELRARTSTRANLMPSSTSARRACGEGIGMQALAHTGRAAVLITLGAALFLEAYVLATATAAHLAIFFVGSYVVFSTYFVADHFMKKFSDSYDAIPDDKKFYVLSNLIKSAVLLACALLPWDR